MAACPAPFLDQQFVLLAAGELQGELAVVLPELGPTLDWNLEVEDNTLLLTLVYDRIAGDQLMAFGVSTRPTTPPGRDTQGHTGTSLARTAAGPTLGVAWTA